MKKEIEEIVFRELFGFELNTKPINGWIILEEKFPETFEAYKNLFKKVMKIIKKINPLNL